MQASKEVLTFHAQMLQLQGLPSIIPIFVHFSNYFKLIINLFVNLGLLCKKGEESLFSEDWYDWLSFNLSQVLFRVLRLFIDDLFDSLHLL